LVATVRVYDHIPWQESCRCLCAFFVHPSVLHVFSSIFYHSWFVIIFYCRLWSWKIWPGIAQVFPNYFFISCFWGDDSYHGIQGFRLNKISNSNAVFYLQKEWIKRHFLKLRSNSWKFPQYVGWKFLSQIFLIFRYKKFFLRYLIFFFKLWVLRTETIYE
jgi:hypothetical protein